MTNLRIHAYECQDAPTGTGPTSPTTHLGGPRQSLTGAASGNVRPVDYLTQAFIGGVLVPPDGVTADHAALLPWLAWSMPFPTV
ncbi:hypothetical protein [Micromonospora sp. SL4-19]|uniref:hypothetical protein n=1 Tax=Micromonospora sp. SL4-19 TaxID=3399129 RepID=UPI003A4D69CE